MYQTILIPTDGGDASAEAVKAGYALARFCNARVVLVSVLDLDRPSPHSPDTGGFIPRIDIYPGLIPDTEAMLASLEEQGLRQGLAVKSILRQGDAATQILEVALVESADIIVMAAHGHGRIASLLLNLVSQDILQNAPCPVLILGENARQHHLQSAMGRSSSDQPAG